MATIGLQKNRNYNQGGGWQYSSVMTSSTQVTDLEDQDQDICWKKCKQTTRLYI